jgi:hypothetical protein
LTMKLLKSDSAQRMVCMIYEGMVGGETERKKEGWLEKQKKLKTGWERRK